jgi:hypothetical protein
MRLYDPADVPFRGGNFPGWVPVNDSREAVRDVLRNGTEMHCPTCGQNVKLYDRALSLATGKVMVKLYEVNQGREYVDLGPILDTMKGTPRQGGYGTLAHHWELIEAQPGERKDGSKRVGWWRLTDDGRAFVRSEITVLKKAQLYDNHLFGFVGKEITISDCLRTPFDFRDLMNGNEPPDDDEPPRDDEGDWRDL